MRYATPFAAAALACLCAAAQAAPETASDADAARACGVSEADYARAPVAYVCNAVRLIELGSYVIGKVDWPAIKAQALATARTAKTVEETHVALAAALANLADGHSQFLGPQSTQALDNPTPRTDRVVAGPANVTVIDVQGFRGTNRDSMAAYIRALRRDLADAEARNPCAYIVDLRRDSGGNIWPVLLALQPLLGTGKIGAFADREGGSYGWMLGDDRIVVGKDVAIASSDELPRAASAASRPVAVLLGPYTASSGEAAAIAFRQRPRTRSFGWHTYGATTANALLRLPDGAAMALATANMTDRDGVAYRQVPVDEETTAERMVHRSRGRIDITQAAGLHWLRTEYGCGEPE